MAILSAVPLLLKLFLNLADGTIKRSSLRTAGKNALGLMVISFLGAIVAAFSALLPSQIGNRLIKGIAFSAPATFKMNSKVPPDKRSMLAEIGPGPTPPETEAFHHFNGSICSLSLPKTRLFPLVTGLEGIVLDTCDVPFPDSDRYRICFNATSSYYQKHLPRIVAQNPALKCNSRLFNYPGVTKSNIADSFTGLVNAGIAQVYDLAERNSWSNAAIEKNLHLYAYCSGVPIALQVAAYFKQKYHIKLLVFADRSYASLQKVGAENCYQSFGLPVWYGKWLFASMLYAGGEFHMGADSLLNDLDYEQIYAINIKEIAPQTDSWSNELRKKLGIGEAIALQGDPLVPDSSTLLREMRAHRSTAKIISALDIPHERHVYAATSHANLHLISLEELTVEDTPNAAEHQPTRLTALQYYSQVLAFK